MTLSSNELAIQRTKLANQRTYLAYMRTGFVISTIAGTYKKLWIVIFGIIMIILSSIQYIYLNYNLNNKSNPSNYFIDFIPIIYIIISFGVLYLEFI